MNPVRIHEGWGHSRQDYFCDTVQCFYLDREMDSLQLLTLYLTLTHIFSGGKAKINLHTTPKLTVVMSINCLLWSIQFPSPQNDAITSCCRACFPATLLYVFNRAPQQNHFLNLLTVAWFIQHFFFAIHLCFLQSLNKDSSISFRLGSFLFLSKPSVRHQCKRMTSYPMT